VKEYLIAATY